MCGIVGLFAKTKAVEQTLGHHLAAMLIEMTERGPDSAGVAFYRNPAPKGQLKVSLFAAPEAFDWDGLVEGIGTAFGDVHRDQRSDHVVLTLDAEVGALTAWLAAHHPEVKIVSAGTNIEIFKSMGLPVEVAERYGLDGISGTHALGHTRMATESAVTTEHSHPFSTGLDLCLVHNGSLSNHNRLRQKLRRAGITFQTDNDSEVAAGYLTWRLREGDTLDEALGHALKELDGFFTFAIGTKNGFAVVRDAIACKHAVLAETDDWVAMATEYRSIAKLPGANKARIWEPAPAQIYSWSRA